MRNFEQRSRITNLRYSAAAKPQPKERGVYAASTLEVPEPMKWKSSLELLEVEAA
jgi:hypothetical protein